MEIDACFQTTPLTGGSGKYPIDATVFRLGNLATIVTR